MLTQRSTIAGAVARSIEFQTLMERADGIEVTGVELCAVAERTFWSIARFDGKDRTHGECLSTVQRAMAAERAVLAAERREIEVFALMDKCSRYGVPPVERLQVLP